MALFPELKSIPNMSPISIRKTFGNRIEIELKSDSYLGLGVMFSELKSMLIFGRAPEKCLNRPSCQWSRQS